MKASIGWTAPPDLVLVRSLATLCRGAVTPVEGETKSLTSISGPIEVRPNLEQPSHATLDVHIRPLASISGTDSKALAATLKALLTPSLLLSHHPRTLVQIVGQALCGSNSGSGMGSAGKGWNTTLIASLVNATTAALLNTAAVPMRGVVCAVSVGRLRSQSASPTLILDPSESELPYLSGSGCFAFLFSSVVTALPDSEASSDVPPCSLLWTNYSANTSFTESELVDARKLAERGAVEVWKALKESLGSMGKSAVTLVGWKRDKNTTVKEVAEEPSESASESEVDDEKMEI
ncbi:uncharacterized protein FIBRA_04232 [Fibroporia radiculosa]|uniref:Exoribonuclease phosphorolytic domain-containing protein n=1 Tax=Fibroporia radiculosa TaxID=599839 RepID=J4H2U9_9APHY|nr:uncharacterized protein FIBRA_04232 [Fibroporia radiculosa]CCM02154.1 predicted protein [Fibroporia radiculosa]